MRIQLIMRETVEYVLLVECFTYTKREMEIVKGVSVIYMQYYICIGMNTGDDFHVEQNNSR